MFVPPHHLIVTTETPFSMDEEHQLLQKLSDAADREECVSVLFNLPMRPMASSIINRLETLLSDNDPLICFLAARSIAITQKEHSPPIVEEILLQMLADPKPLQEAFHRVFNILEVPPSETVRFICMSLCLVAINHPDNVIPCLEAAMDKGSGSAAADIAHTLLYFAFHNRKVSPNMRMADLDDRRRRVIHILLSSRRAWRFSGNMRLSLTSFGLPGTKDQLGAFANS